MRIRMGVQKTRDGEALGGSAPTAAQAFGAPQPAVPPVRCCSSDNTKFCKLYATATSGTGGSHGICSAATDSLGAPTGGVNPITGTPY